MSNPTTSLVSVAKETALRAAEAILEDVKSRRAVAKEEDILRAMAAERVKIGWFKYRPFSREEAEALVESHKIKRGCDYPRPYGWWSLVEKGNETLANQLVSAANLTQDGYIWLNLEEARLISTFLT